MQNVFIVWRAWEKDTGTRGNTRKEIVSWYKYIYIYNRRKILVCGNTLWLPCTCCWIPNVIKLKIRSVIIRIAEMKKMFWLASSRMSFRRFVMDLMLLNWKDFRVYLYIPFTSCYVPTQRTINYFFAKLLLLN